MSDDQTPGNGVPIRKTWRRGPPKTGRRLTPQQRLFASEYAKDFNGSEAAIRAGYAPSGASSIACRFLKDKAIIAQIQHVTRPALEKNQVTTERIVDELAAVGFANMQDYVEPEIGADGKPTGWFQIRDITQLPRQLCAAIAEVIVDEAGGGGGDGKREKVVRIRLKMHDKMEALSMLGKYKKLFTERIEVGLSDELLARLDRGRQRLLTLKAGSNGNGNGNGNGSAHPGPVAG